MLKSEESALIRQHVLVMLYVFELKIDTNTPLISSFYEAFLDINPFQRCLIYKVEHIAIIKNYTT